MLFPEVIAELSRAISYLALGFAAGVIFHPFVAGWWPRGEDGK